MQLREAITLPDVDGTWTTNLTDSELREFHALYDRQLPTEEIRFQLFNTSIVFRVITTTVSFRNGACLWYGINNRHTVIFRTHEEWELWNARKREVEELRQEQATQEAIERQLFRTEDEYLSSQASEASEKKDYASAAQCYGAKAELRQKFPNLDAFSGLFVEDILFRFSGFPSSSYGIAYLRRYYPFANYFQRFASMFRSWNRLPDSQKVAEIDQIFDEATDLFVDDGGLLKNASLFWRREGHLDLAIKYCRIALGRGLHDDTKSGFAGRLKRLIGEQGRAESD